MVNAVCCAPVAPTLRLRSASFLGDLQAHRLSGRNGRGPGFNECGAEHFGKGLYIVPRGDSEGSANSRRQFLWCDYA